MYFDANLIKYSKLKIYLLAKSTCKNPVPSVSIVPLLVICKGSNFCTCSSHFGQSDLGIYRR